MLVEDGDIWFGHTLQLTCSWEACSSQTFTPSLEKLPHRFFHHPSRTFPLLIWFSPCFPVQFDCMFCFYIGSTSKFSSCYHWGISTIVIGAGILLTWCRNQWIWDSEAWRFGRTEKRRKKSWRAVACMEASSWKDSFHLSPFQGQTLGVIVNAPLLEWKYS